MTVSESKKHERVEIKNGRKVSRTTIHGWPSLVFGLPFAGVGVFVLLLWSGQIEMDPGKVHAPLWVIGVFGLMFLLAGLSLMWHGVDGIRRKAKIKSLKATRAGSPWLWDYEWQALGITDNKFKKVIHALVMLIVMGTFLAPFNWWAFASGEGGTMVTLMVGFFDLVFGLAGGYYFFHNLTLYMKFGNSRLRFSDFPFFLGDKLKVKLVDLPREIDHLQLDLRFIEEQYEYRGSGKNRSQQVVCYQLFHEERTVPGNAVSPSGFLAVEWLLPTEPEITSTLSERPARFWELEVKADTPGVDYHSRFLLPIYARS